MSDKITAFKAAFDFKERIEPTPEQINGVYARAGVDRIIKERRV